MDSLWQQHRTFILKVLGGLLVVLVCWIIGSSMTEGNLSKMADDNASMRSGLSRKKVPSSADTTAFQNAVDRLETRVEFLADQIGETRKGDDLRRGLIEEILASVQADTPENITRFLGLSRTSPVACVVGLRGIAKDELMTLAGLQNVILPDEVLRIVEMDASQADRYLMTIKLVVEVVKIAIEEGLIEVKSIKWEGTAASRFAGEDLFVREYPVTIELRGPSVAMLNFLAKVTSAEHFLPIRKIGKLGHDRSERDPEVMTAEIEFMSLRVDPQAELRE
jgi:Tfp pilus assembly protein PilO